MPAGMEAITAFNTKLSEEFEMTVMVREVPGAARAGVTTIDRIVTMSMVGLGELNGPL